MPDKITSIAGLKKAVEDKIEEYHYNNDYREGIVHGLGYAKALISEFEASVRGRLKELERDWKKHLEGEGGSCYCLANENSCRPEIIKELHKLLSKGGC